MLIRGDKLTRRQREIVLRAFTYRLTTENGYPERNPCGARVPAISDDEWLKERAFHFLKDGSRLMANRHRAEPHYLAGDD